MRVTILLGFCTYTALAVSLFPGNLIASAGELKKPENTEDIGTALAKDVEYKSLANAEMSALKNKESKSTKEFFGITTTTTTTSTTTTTTTTRKPKPKLKSHQKKSHQTHKKTTVRHNHRHNQNKTQKHKVQADKVRRYRALVENVHNNRTLPVNINNTATTTTPTTANSPVLTVIDTLAPLNPTDLATTAPVNVGRSTTQLKENANSTAPSFSNTITQIPVALAITDLDALAATKNSGLDVNVKSGTVAQNKTELVAPDSMNQTTASNLTLVHP